MQEKEKSEIITVGSQELAETTDDIIASAERRAHRMDKIITLSLGRTNSNDWVDQNGKPYLTASGAEKIARLFGICSKILKTEKVQSDNEKGPFYFYQVKGVFTMCKDSLEAVGTCSSTDQFFAKVKGVLKPMSEVDETNILKAAITNCTVNGITRLLGIRNLTWPEVEKGGIDKSKVAGVKYASGGGGGGIISEKQRNRFYAIYKKAGKTDENVKKYLFDVYKYNSSKDIETKVYDDIVQWAENLETNPK